MAAILDFIFLCYFVSHIPISIFIDAQVLLPQWIFPAQAIELKSWYCREFKDAMMVDPPPWFKTFIYCEFLIQFPVFLIASYTFITGIKNHPWMRIPLVAYSSHVATTTAAIIYHIMYNDFSKSKHPGPNTPSEKYTLTMIYFPYFFIPLLMMTNFMFRRDLKEKHKSE